MSEAEFSHPLRVYIEDTDAGGIVYYVNYLKFMERARTEYMRERGYGKDYIFNHDLMFVVHDVAVKYRDPARLDTLPKDRVLILQHDAANRRLSWGFHDLDSLVVAHPLP